MSTLESGSVAQSKNIRHGGQFQLPTSSMALHRSLKCDPAAESLERCLVSLPLNFCLSCFPSSTISPRLDTRPEKADFCKAKSHGVRSFNDVEPIAKRAELAPC